jgi:hypothetical protein
MPLRVAAAFMPLRVAALFARNRSDRFPAPSCGQALRPAPVMNVDGWLQLVAHASAAIKQPLFVCSFVHVRACANDCW